MNTHLSPRHTAPFNAPRHERGARMIVAEGDRLVIGPLLASLEGGSDLIVHVQQPRQGALSFARGIVHALGALERSGRTLRQAVIVAGANATPETRAGRELSTRALVEHLARTGGGELELVGPPESSPELREELLLVVETLLPLSRGSVSFRVRYARDAQPEARRRYLA